MTGEELLALMEPLDLTQDAIAAATGYSRGAVAHWISRNQQIPARAMLKLLPLLITTHHAKQAEVHAKYDQLCTIGEILPLLA
jgi:transcriptional regulator with XRE-family HTH domain